MERDILIRKLRIFAILTRAKEIQKEITLEREMNEYYKTEALKITDPYKDLPKVHFGDLKDGKQNRRERRAKERTK
jgi:hypothetical protein